MKKISKFSVVNAEGERILKKDVTNWVKKQNPWRAFDVVKYVWDVDGIEQVANKGGYWVELPDATGFICFESDLKDGNCCILDVYGRIKHRLFVPVDKTSYDVPEGAERWFRNIGGYPGGEFGVTAWIEFAGDFYFELDYKNAEFLWGKEIRF